jgi:hypothetical protein
MSHEDAAKVQVGFGKCVYCWPGKLVMKMLQIMIISLLKFDVATIVFAGDTVRKTFKVKSIRNTSDGNHSVS